MTDALDYRDPQACADRIVELEKALAEAQESLSTAESFRLNFEHATKIEREDHQAERDTLLGLLRDSSDAFEECMAAISAEHGCSKGEKQLCWICTMMKVMKAEYERITAALPKEGE